MRKDQNDMEITLDGSPLTIEDVVQVAACEHSVRISKDTAFVDRIARGALFLDQLHDEEGKIYGVTTGYGDACTIPVPADLVDELPHRLFTFHGCGAGNKFSHQVTRAILTCRTISLCKGFSGVTYGLLEQIQQLFDHDVMPVIPEEGSVGASGDLTPLSYIAAVLCGEREVWYQGQIQPTAKVFDSLGIKPIRLRPKEGLAIMNGTAVMTGVACMAFSRARYLSRLTTRLTAMATVALKGNAHHFDEFLFSVKPHPGQQQVAKWLREDLFVGEAPRNPWRLQDRYSIRCAPHVIGALEDALPWLRSLIENEMNSANDNPIIDGEGERVLHGGHFYGGHIALAMDTLKNTIANLADLMDRQMALLMDTKFNQGLPPSLVGSTSRRAAINHGFKAVQIGVSAWTAEALKHTMPASVFSRSTECHNQDKVSMGTIAARDCMRVLQLSEQVASALLLAVCQATDIRVRDGDVLKERMNPELLKMLTAVREISPFLEEDRALEHELAAVVQSIQSSAWPLYGDA